MTRRTDALGRGAVSASPDARRRAREVGVAVISDATPGRNGVGTYYDDLVRHLEGHLGSVRLFSPPRDGEEATGGWRIAMPGDPTQRLFIPWIPRLWREVVSQEPDVIVAPTPGLYGLLGMLLARRIGCAFCVAYHTEFPKLAELYWGDRFGFGRIARGIVRWLDQVMFRDADAVLVHNADLLGSVRSRGVEDVELMGTPAPPPFLDAPGPAPGGEVRAVAFIGRLAPEKNVDQILAAARANPGVRFRFVGDGPVREQVIASAAERDNVEFLGWVGRERVMEVLDDSDVVVLPSTHETFGTAAYEAMVRRRLALVSPACGIVEWPDLSEGLVTMEPGEDVPAALERILAMAPARRRRIAERGREAALEQNRITVEHWIRVMADVAPEPDPG